MSENLQEFKKEIGVKWIKASSGTSYLCPTDAFSRIANPNNPTEADLKKICVDESQNPQND